ncbi:TonB-dependent receptor [Parafilimonas terrae]|uniref:Outer membrane receptor proteins, mostly Fe transport n=1 Tax=Parafilimonas terrae TaxID=1465490 RepID=A0A1I5YPG3_9BACT|nr:TonB-dependent receptor [Parafilimonas terrae]SFQ46161.1 Outer membrane receptor proteins, mostly Fe transport [Parafilimonas terrae]
MKTFFTLTVILNCCFSIVNAQYFSINGNVVISEKPLEAATVMLLKPDSSMLKQQFSDKNGHFLIDKITKGHYLVSVQFVGNETWYSPLLTLDNEHPMIDLKTISLQSSAKLSDVVVTSQKQFIEQKIDKTVVNIDASPTNAGLSAYEILEKTPGVVVDKDGNISLKGKGGVVVMIDGKPTYLSAQDLANYLKNLPSTSLDQIELMTNPSAKYDAAGNSGIINFKTKKTKVKGFSAGVTAGYGIGKFPKTNESINFNYRSGKVNVFGNYSYNYSKRYHTLELERNFRNEAGEIDTKFMQTSDMQSEYQSHYFKTGLDFYATKKTTLGFSVNGNFNPGTNSNNNVTDIYNAANALQNETYTNSVSKNNWKNYGANLNMETKFDSTGRELSANIDYLQYQSSSGQLFINKFFDAKNNKVSADELLRGDLPSKINIYSGKIDYVHPLKNNLKIEAGLKSSYVKTDNNALYTNFINNEWVTDSGRSNHFVYEENINAAYINTSKQFNKKWSAQLGLRLENTNAKGRQLTTGETFKRNYTQLFPTAYINYTLNDKNQLNLNYGRRIQRPDYGDMNPFYYFLDKYTYEVGNPYLKPQFSHNIELTHVYKNMITSTFSYVLVNDIINEQLMQIDSTHTTYVTKTNLAKQNSFTLSVNAAVPVTKWWRANLYVQGAYNKYKGFVNTGIINVEGPAFNANMQNQFTLPKGWSAELSGYFNSKAIYGTVVGLPQGTLNFAVAKKVLKDKGSVKLNVRDFLGIQQWRGYSRYQNVDVKIHNKWESRVVNLTFTYRFSKGQKAEQRNHSSSDEEQSRVKGKG